MLSVDVIVSQLWPAFFGAGFTFLAICLSLRGVTGRRSASPRPTGARVIGSKLTAI